MRENPIGKIVPAGSRAGRHAGSVWLLEIEMLRVCLAPVLAFVAIAALTRPSEAGVSHLFDRAELATGYSGQSDLVTAYTTGMARYRLQYTAQADHLAAPLEPRLLRPEFVQRTWRAADGSLLQGFAGRGGFRMNVGNCLARLCLASECGEAGWPVYACSDGRKGKMSVRKSVTATFDGVSYRRLGVPND